MQAAVSSNAPSLFDHLSGILEAEHNVATRPRVIPAAVQSALSESTLVRAYELHAPMDTRSPDATRLLAHVRSPLAKDYLAKDIVALVSTMGRLLNRKHLHASLSVIADDGCRKFHADHVGLRLLCTYAGPGTEWLENADVNRHELEKAKKSFDDANAAVMRHPSAVRRTGPGEIIILKGDAYPGNHGKGAVHRSPVEELGARRLMLKLDERACGC